MSRISISVFVAAAVLSAGSALAQTAPTPAPTAQSSPQQSSQARTQAQSQVQSAQKANTAQAKTSQTRPDASYAHPSGQDSHTGNTPKTTTLASANSKKGTGAKVENRGTKAADQAKPVDQLAQRNSYSGAAGSKANPGTGCSTARPTKDGGVDCGTTGDSATLGKIVTKPR